MKQPLKIIFPVRPHIRISVSLIRQLARRTLLAHFEEALVYLKLYVFFDLDLYFVIHKMAKSQKVSEKES